MKNSTYSNESVARYIKNGYAIETENEDLAILVKRRKVGIFWNLVLSLLTGGFWLLVWIPRLIFRNAVVKLYKGQIPEKQPGVTSKIADLGLERFQNLSARGKLIIFGTAVLAIAVFFISGSVTKNNAEIDAKNAKYETHSSLLESKIQPSTCSAIKQVLLNGNAVTFANRYVGRVSKISKNLTVWNAESYLLKSDWIKPSETLMLEFETEQKQITNKLLADRLTKLDPKSQSVGTSELDGTWGDNFRLFAIGDCLLGEIESKSKGKIIEVATAASVIQVKASSKPWFPMGYQEAVGFPGFAFQNISNQGCSYSFGSCAKFKIVSQKGCPESLYVETNLEANGEVIDWSNDTARGLRPGQVALMETTFSSERSGSWSIVKISCY